ncbi:MAG TPA: SctK family type III secretion system sorting platform protein, partial [Povalibacter sp.]|nr:SctK family type III secretion system sorting platform protein [Povalibacter sp.]
MPSDATASPVSGSAPPDASDQLFDLQLQFNLFPACYAHLSWIEATGFLQLHDGPAPVASPFSIRRLSDALLRQNGLEHQFDFDFSDRAKRLALLDASHLERIGAFGAAILVRDQIRRTVRGTDIDAMRRCIGADAHLHALRWEGAAAEIFAPAPAADWSDPQSWQLYGATLVSACIPPSAPGVLHRLW